MTGGCHIAIVGMDGIGKSTLANDLVDVFRAAGRKAEVLSWRREIEGAQQHRVDYPTRSLQNLWFEIFRLHYAGAVDNSGPLKLPDSYEELMETGGTEQFSEVDYHGVRAAGPLTGCLLEVAGNILLHNEVVRPRVAEGEIVIQESYGYKHALKELLLADQLLASDDGSTSEPMATIDSVDRIEQTVRRLFLDLLAPDVGIHLDGPAELAKRWRMAQGGIGAFEAGRVADGDHEAGFLQFQMLTSSYYRRLAADGQWLTVTSTDADQATNRSNHLQAIGAVDELAHLLNPEIRT